MVASLGEAGHYYKVKPEAQQSKIGMHSPNESKNQSKEKKRFKEKGAKDSV